MGNEGIEFAGLNERCDQSPVADSMRWGGWCVREAALDLVAAVVEELDQVAQYLAMYLSASARGKPT